MEVVAQPTGSADAQNSLLLSMLPGEIRNEIYRLVLLSSDVIVIESSTVRGQRSLFQTCHQIRKEALKIYYCENTFSVGTRGSSINDITKFLSAKDKSIGRVVSQLTVVHVLGREEMVKACLIAAAVCGSCDLATAQKIGDELRGMVVKSGTAAARKLLHAGISLCAITVTLPERHGPECTSDTVHQMRDIFVAQHLAIVEMYGE
jgi:hypothetical protein